MLRVIGNLARIGKQARQVEAPLPRSYLAGLQLTRDLGDTSHDINIAAGVCRDSTNAVNMSVSDLTKQIDNSGTWAEGDDAGGFPDDTLNLATSTWYHVHLIGNGTKTDAGFDTSFSATNLLSEAQGVDPSYLYYRRIGSVMTDISSNLTAFLQNADRFFWEDPPLDIDVTENATADTRTISTPPGLTTLALVNLIATSSGGYEAVYASSPDVDDEAPSATAAPLSTVGGTSGGSAQHAGYAEILTDSSSQIRTRAASAAVPLKVATLGWVDRRGKDD